MQFNEDCIKAIYTQQQCEDSIFIWQCERKFENYFMSWSLNLNILL